ncbi:MAG: L-threonylcarbamoyladenylate synthase, partial [Desulfococcaceae bacterium]
MPDARPPADVAPADLRAAAQVLRSGGLVAFPTETVYGLGADALNPDAVARVFEAKGRPRFDPLIVHVPDARAAQALTTAWPKAAAALAELWPGPITLVLPRHATVPDIVTAGLDTVALRVPDHPVALSLLRALGRPVAAPSANRFGRVSPTTADHVAEQLPEVDLVLDGGPCSVGIESTIVSVLPGEPVRLLRPGGVALEALEALVGSIEIP